MPTDKEVAESEKLLAKWNQEFAQLFAQIGKKFQPGSPVTVIVRDKKEENDFIWTTEKDLSSLRKAIDRVERRKDKKEIDLDQVIKPFSIDGKL